MSLIERDYMSREKTRNDEHLVIEVVEAKSRFPGSLIVLLVIAALIAGLSFGFTAASDPGKALSILGDVRDWLRSGLWVWFGFSLVIGAAVLIWRGHWFDEIFEDDSLTGRISKFFHIRKGLVWLIFMTGMFYLLTKLGVV